MSLLLFFLLAPLLSADVLSVRPLYDQNSRIPEALIPFRIEGDAIRLGKITSLQALTNNGADCRARVDPYLRDIILLKCMDESSVTLKIQITQGTLRYVVDFGPLEVRKPSPDLVVIKPTPTDPNILAGRQLFNTYCIGCHTIPADKAPRSAAVLKSAVLNQPTMKHLSSVLSTADYAKLEAYLGSL